MSHPPHTYTHTHTYTRVHNAHDVVQHDVSFTCTCDGFTVRVFPPPIINLATCNFFFSRTKSEIFASAKTVSIVTRKRVLLATGDKMRNKEEQTGDYYVVPYVGRHPLCRTRYWTE